jgi:hypothetical protein
MGRSATMGHDKLLIVWLVPAPSMGTILPPLRECLEETA